MRHKPGEVTFKEGRTWMRRCSGCGEVKPLRKGFYKTRRRPERSWIGEYGYRCKPCEIERNTAKTKRKEADPEYKHYRAELMKQWREANPEKDKASRRRYLEKIRSEPHRHIVHLETRRIEGYLRREKKDAVTSKHQPGRMLEITDEMLPVEPLLEVVNREIVRGQRDDISIEETCKSLGISGREHRRWVTREQKMVRFETADKILTKAGLHWWDVWDESEVPERIAA